MITILFFVLFGKCIEASGQKTAETGAGSSEIRASREEEPTDVGTDTAIIRILYDRAVNSMYSNPTDAEKLVRQALQASREIRSRGNIAYGYYLLGIIMTDRGDYIEADRMLNEGLIRYSKIKDKRGIAISHNGLGILHIELNDPEKALEYLQKSADLFSRLKQEKEASQIRLNIGSIYIDTENYDKAYPLHSELIGYFQSRKDTENLIPALQNMGEVFESAGNNDSAEYYFSKSLLLAEAFRGSKELLDSYHFMGRILGSKKQFSASNEFLLKAMILADSLQSKEIIARVGKCLSENYAGLGDTGRAYTYLKLDASLGGELRKLEATKIIARRELDAQNRISRNRTQLFYMTLITLFISFMLILAVFRNYRIKQKANRLLIEMDDLKSKLFSNITHEFRTPLTLILGPLEEILSADEKKNPTRKEIKMMRRNARRLLNLVNQMLDLAKLDARSLKIELSEADFLKFLRVRVASFASIADHKGINYTWSIPEGEFITLFDADKLEKIINNLLSNALKFTDNGGKVRFITEFTGKNREALRFTVTDTGKGIPEDQLPRIFDRFHQVSGDFSPDSFGTGIGLSLTRELVTLLHGEIHVESEPGSGSAFTVTLPVGIKHLNKEEYIVIENVKPDQFKTSATKDELSDDEDHPAPAVTGERPPTEDLPLILAVDDQKEIRDYLTEHLRDNFRIIEAENGITGWEAAVNNLPDLVITDLIMPGMDGIEFCRKLKTDEKTSHIPVVMLTARADVEDRLEGFETGADNFLTKPFDIREIRMVITKLIEQRTKLRERFRRNIKLEPKDIAITPADEKFLQRLLSIIENHMGDFDFEVSTLEEEMAMSRMQLFRKIKALTDQSPGEFVRTIRLKRAAKLIEQGFGNIAQVTFEVGFSNPSYFAGCFRDLYGSLPSEYAKKFRKA